MATDRTAYILDSLVSHMIPAYEDEDKQTIQERHDRCFQIAKSIIEDAGRSSITPDVSHSADLIKRKLYESNPNQALRFSNLYNRLLSLPVLEQKWAILHLLNELSDSPEESEPLPLSPVRPSDANHRETANLDTLSKATRDPIRSSPSSKAHVQQFREAFQPDGLRVFPAKDSKPDESLDKDVVMKIPGQLSGYDDMEPSEPVLLRDLPFILQGLSSTNLSFQERDTLKLPTTLPLPLISILHTLAEPSLLYRGLEEFCKTPGKGLLAQSLRSGIGGELRAYLNLIATLEGQIRRALADLDESSPRGGIGKAGVTLKRCVVWTREATMGLRLMSLLAEESQNKRGGQLITLVHSFASSHGDPVVAAFAERLLGTCTRPFYDILRRWIYDGELSDPYQEFFVQEQPPNREPRSRGGANVWEDKYEIAEDMVPSIITQDFAQKVFLIGKSLNFIRHSCGDSLWVEDYSKGASKELRYGDTATLEAWIDEAYKTTMKRLMDLMSNKFHLFDHLEALKRYILLGQGDFIALLMKSLAANLDRPAGAQYRHTLTAQLEHAIRGSNAQYDSQEVLRRLDARMLQLSHGDIGWDCFTLEYKIDAPVDVVVTEWGNRQYLKVFNFLWRIKRVEFTLLSSWRSCTTGARGVLQTSEPEVAQTWKSTRGTLAEMIHFVGQLQYYILFEVIESSWNELQARIRKDDCTLDDLIKAHESYLNDITHKGLLGAKRRHPNGPADSDDRATYLVQLSEILRLMLNYRDCVQGLYSWSVSDYTRRQEAGVRSGLASRNTDLDDDEDMLGTSHHEADSEFPLLQERLAHLGSSFRMRLRVLLGDLAYQPDVDMRFLGVAMNFNNAYQPVGRRSKTASTTATGNASMVASRAEGR